MPHYNKLQKTRIHAHIHVLHFSPLKAVEFSKVFFYPSKQDSSYCFDFLSSHSSCKFYTDTHQQARFRGRLWCRSPSLSSITIAIRIFLCIQRKHKHQIPPGLHVQAFPQIITSVCLRVRAHVSLYQLETFFQQSKSVRADSTACCNNFQELERSSSTPSGNFGSTSKKWGSGKVNMKQQSTV